MRNSLLLLLLATSCSLVSAQSLTPVFRANLPGGLSESSGIVARNRNSLWTHNDSGGANELYELDSNAVLQRTLVLRNATQVDWEDLTLDSAGHFYVGDFGNNSQNRTDLVIYKLQGVQISSDDGRVVAVCFA